MLLEDLFHSCFDPGTTFCYQLPPLKQGYATATAGASASAGEGGNGGNGGNGGDAGVAWGPPPGFTGFILLNKNRSFYAFIVSRSSSVNCHSTARQSEKLVVWLIA